LGPVLCVGLLATQPAHYMFGMLVLFIIGGGRLY